MTLCCRPVRLRMRMGPYSLFLQSPWEQVRRHCASGCGPPATYRTVTNDADAKGIGSEGRGVAGVCGRGTGARSCNRACYSKCSIASPASCRRGVSVKAGASSGGAAPHLAPLHGPSRRSLHPPPSNDTNYDHHNRENQKDMNESIYSGRGEKTQMPEGHQYDDNGLMHFSYPSGFGLVVLDV